jgi:tRNA-(ms[2]io[6]A)-hydroxylase
MLSLSSETDPRWLPAALADLPTILLDHAHCEKKAASSAMGLIFRYQERPALMRPLSELAREELRHFETVLEMIRGRGRDFERQVPSPYAARLMAAVRKPEPHRLLDTLIGCALIEARSCERMRLLAEALEDEELARLYRGLLASEARHHTTYLDLARRCFPEEEVRERLAALSAHEGAVIARGAAEIGQVEIRLHT